MRDFLVYSLPVVLNEVMWGLGTSANTAVLGHMGSSAVAANSVAQVARQLATVVSFGLSSATAIYLGKTIGERKFDHARAYAKRFIILSVVMGVIGGGSVSYTHLDVYKRQYLCSRTLAHAGNVQKEFQEIEIISYEQRYEVMKQCDIVVSATSAPHVVVKQEYYTPEKQVTFLDLATPRDIDPKLSDCLLYTSRCV